MKLAKWNKPGTNEVRIYINGITELFGKKAYITALNNEGEADNWTIKSFDVFGSALDSLVDRVESALIEMNNGENVVTFGQVLALVK